MNPTVRGPDSTELAVELDATDICTCSNRPLDVKEMLAVMLPMVKYETKLFHNFDLHKPISDIKCYTMEVNTESLTSIYTKMPETLKNGCDIQCIKDIDKVLPDIIEASKLDVTQKILDMVHLWCGRDLLDLNSYGVGYVGIEALDGNNWAHALHIIDVERFVRFARGRLSVSNRPTTKTYITDLTTSLLRKQKSKRACYKALIYLYYAILAMLTAAISLALIIKK